MLETIVLGVVVLNCQMTLKYFLNQNETQTKMRERWIKWYSNKKSKVQSYLFIYKMDDYNDGAQELGTSFRVFCDMLR